jgi:hypothetical protein
MQNIKQRLKEPSTWAGIAMLAAIFGVDPTKVSAIGQVANAAAAFVPADGGGYLAHVVTAVGAALAVFLPEKQPTAATPPTE